MKLNSAISLSVLIVEVVIGSTIQTRRDLLASTESVPQSVVSITEENKDATVITESPKLISRERFKDFRISRFETEEIPSDKVGEAANAVKVFVAETIYDVSTIVEKISTGVYRTASAFAADTLQFIIIARDNVTDVIKVIATKILEIDDENVKEFFENVKEVLEKVQQLFVNLLTKAENEFDNILNHVNNTIMSMSEDMEDWSRGIKLKLRSVKDDTIYKKGCDYIDTFVSSSVEEAYECCNIAIKPMRSICNNAKDVIGDTLNILVDIVEKVEVCILEKKARIPVMIACLDDVYDKVVEFMKHASDLKDSLFKTLPSKIMISNFCFSMSAVSVEVRKIDISNEIDKKYLK